MWNCALSKITTPASCLVIISFSVRVLAAQLQSLAQFLGQRRRLRKPGRILGSYAENVLSRCRGMILDIRNQCNLSASWCIVPFARV